MIILKNRGQNHSLYYAVLNTVQWKSKSETKSNVFSLFQLSEYDFEVFPVQNCPMSKESWKSAAAELKCNKTQGYHCVPNKNYTSLIQFCYPRGYKIPVQKGIFKLIFPGFLFCCVFPGYNHIHLNKTY